MKQVKKAVPAAAAGSPDQLIAQMSTHDTDVTDVTGSPIIELNPPHHPLKPDK